MKPEAVSFLSIILLLVSLPLLSRAQANHEGNHCVATKSPLRLAMDSGKVVYLTTCFSCHQADGLGVINVNPPLTRKEVIEDKKKLIALVINGLATHEDINGVSYPNVMPPNPQLSDQEIAYLLTYIRNSFGNKASSVKSPEVKSQRSKLNAAK